jgi:hypothetical protein
MSYVRKIALAAVTGAAVSSFVSANRKIFDFVLRNPRRQKRVAELRQWYEAELESIDLYAEEKSGQFVQEHRALLLKTDKDGEYSDSVANGYLAGARMSVRELIRLREQACITRECGIRLYDVDAQLGYEQEKVAAKLMAQRDATVEQMEAAGYPVNLLSDWLRTRKRA